MNITVKQLRAFRAVVEAGGFGRAARQLGTSQPVISGQIRDLESELGVRLLQRTTRQVSLTEEGAGFVTEAQLLLDRLDGAVERVQDMASERSSRFRLAAPPLLAASFLPPVLAQFADAHPDLRVELLDVPTDAMLRALASGQVDAALGTVPEDYEVGSRHVVLRDRLMLFVPDASPLGRDGPVRWRSLENESIVQLAPGSGIRALVDREAARRGRRLPSGYEVVNLMTVLAMVEAGLGVAVLPSYAATGLGARAMRAVDLAGAPVTREIVLVTSPSYPAPTAVAAFLHDVQRHAKSVEQSASS